jgi:TolB protein
MYMMKANGTDRKLVATGSGEGTWSPNGRKIAFVHGYSDLTVMKANGSGMRQLAEGEEPAWSPDGTRIAWSDGEGMHGSVYVMSADGTNVRKLAAGQSPVWRPRKR